MSEEPARYAAPRAGQSPAQMAAQSPLAKRQAEAERRAQERAKLAKALRAVLGQAGNRTEDQKLVWKLLVDDRLRLIAPADDPNTILIYEGARRLAVELADLIDHD